MFHQNAARELVYFLNAQKLFSSRKFNRCTSVVVNCMCLKSFLKTFFLFKASFFEKMSPVRAPMLLDSFRRSCFSRKNCKRKQYFLGIRKTYLHFIANCVQFRTILWSCREVRLFLIELSWKERDVSCTLDQRKSEHNFRCKNCFTFNLGILGTLLYLR